MELPGRLLGFHSADTVWYVVKTMLTSSSSVVSVSLVFPWWRLNAIPPSMTCLMGEKTVSTDASGEYSAGYGTCSDNCSSQVPITEILSA